MGSVLQEARMVCLKIWGAQILAPDLVDTNMPKLALETGQTQKSRKHAKEYGKWLQA